MRKANLLAGLAAIVIGAIVVVAPAFAALDEALDGNQHPSVGFMFAQISDPNTCNAQLVSNCAATLVSPTVAVTSAGCAQAFSASDFFNITAVWISFNPDNPFDCATASRVESLDWHPSFDETVAPSPFDVGVAVLSAPATATPATLPAADSQGGYDKGDPFDVVSWGPIGRETVLDWRRRSVPAEMMSSDAVSLRLKLTLNGGHICVGAQGGGAFLPESQDLSALVIYNGRGGCKISDFLRLDTPTVRGFLGGFVTLP